MRSLPVGGSRRSIGPVHTVLFGVLVALGCGSESGGDGAPSLTTGSERPGAETADARTSGVQARTEVPRPPQPFSAMSTPDKQAWMAQEVLPFMDGLFREYDPETHAGFSCQTCHGPDAAARDYAMPSPALLALAPTGSPAQRAMVQEHPRAVRFMFNHVTKHMRTLLDAPDYDAETGTGFGCFSCHPRADDPRSAP